MKAKTNSKAIGSLLAVIIFAVISHVKAATKVVEKDLVWGSVYSNATMSVRTPHDQYVLGQEINIDVRIKNVGDRKIYVTGCGGPLYDYRMVLFNEEGAAVAKSDKLKEAESLGDPSMKPISSTYGAPITPGKTGCFRVNVSERFKIEKPGTYHLIVMRYLTSWNDGFLISNLAKIEIVDSETESTESTDTASE